MINKIKKIIAEVSEKNETEIEMQMELVDDLEIDSMMSLEILTELEKVFGIELSEKDFANFITVDDVFNLVKGKVDEKE